MFKNYLLISLRNLYKNRVYAAINILGLGMALAICIVAYFNYSFDYGFDRTHENFDELYRVTCFRDMSGRSQEYGIIPATLGREIKDEIPGVEYVTRIFNSYSPVKMDKELFERHISYVDPEFFDMFTIPMVSGSSKDLEERNNIIISQDLAKTLFGNASPLGKSVSVINDNSKEFIFTITGVFYDMPENSSFRFDILTHADNFLKMWNLNDTDWRSWSNATFVRLNNAASTDAIVEAMNRYLTIQNRAREDFIITGFKLVPLKDVGDSSREIWSSSLYPGMHPAASIAPPIMALMILLIACFNFANTTIASMGRRLKEIGLRKTFGGFRIQLVMQFLLESMLICALATLVGIAIARFLVPAYSSLWEDMTLTMSMSGIWNFVLFLLGLMLITGFMSGVYPALYISRLSPVNILRSRTKFGKTGIVSNILLTFQFSISIMALIMGVVFLKNAEYQENIDLGYQKDELIVIPIIADNFSEYRDAIKDNPFIVSVAGTQEHIGFGNYRRPIKDEDSQLEVNVFDIGPNYPSTMGLRLVEGRLFDESRADADRKGSIIVNKQLVKDFGWDEAVGRTVTMYDTTRLSVIGVVEDFYPSGIWNLIEPAILRLTPSDIYRDIVIRTDKENLVNVLGYARAKWTELFPFYVFNGMSQEDTMQEEKDINSSILKVNMFLALVATLLSLIGIYSLVSLNVLHRTKEIGIRNVVGSPVGNMIFQLSRKFIIILLIAAVTGSVGGYYLSIGLLDSIWDYFINITIWIPLFSVLIMFIATALTISGKTYKAATQNPVRALQTE